VAGQTGRRKAAMAWPRRPAGARPSSCRYDLSLT